MTSIFLNTVNMNITASYIIIAVIILRFVLKKFPKKYSYLLWSVVGFRLCCPVSFKSVFSIFSLKPFDMTSAQQNNSNALQYIQSSDTTASDVTIGIPSANAIIYDEITSKVTYSEIIDKLTFALSLIWIVGIVVIIAYGIISYIRIKKGMSNAVLLEKGVYQSDCVSSPFILGIVKPKIYIPFGIDSDVQKYVLAHEKHHIKRLDYLVKLFAFVLLAVHWFNPLCWIAFVLMDKDMEMSCDEKVLSETDGIKKNYSTALLSFATNKKFPMPTPLAFSENGVKGRIKNALSFKKPKLILSITALVLCVAILIGCASNPITQDNSQSTTNTFQTYSGGREIYANENSDEVFTGDYLSEITLTKSDLHIKYSTEFAMASDSAPSEFQSVTANATEMTLDEFYKYLTDNYLQSGEKAIPSDCKNVTMVQYYSDKNYNDHTITYNVFWFDEAPLLIGDEMRIYELLPNAKNLDSAVSDAILSQNEEYYGKTASVASESHSILSKRTGSIDDAKDSNYLTVFAIATCYQFTTTDSIFQGENGGEAYPIALEFSVSKAGAYTLSKYWTPRDGSYFQSDLKKVFTNDALEAYYDYSDSDKLTQACYAQAISKSSVDIDKSIEKLFDKIENPNNDLVNASSTPKEYLSASPSEHQLLLAYNEYTINYIFDEFIKGGQTGLKGQLMKILMDEITGDTIKTAYNTGQDYFDSYLEYAKEIYDENKDDDEFLVNNCHYIVILLDKIGYVK